MPNVNGKSFHIWMQRVVKSAKKKVYKILLLFNIYFVLQQ